jgi:hypothetical protein
LDGLYTHDIRPPNALLPIDNAANFAQYSTLSHQINPNANVISDDE